MKLEIQEYIQECRNCWLKKLVKTQQPMVLTETVPLDKVSMDIMGLLPTIESEHSYILTIQYLLIKYSVVVFSITQASNISGNS